MIDKIAKVVARYDEIEKRMADPLVLANHVKLTELAQERSDLTPLAEAFRQHQKMSIELEEAQELLEAEADAEMLGMVEEEINQVLDYIIDVSEGNGRSAPCLHEICRIA